MRVAIIIRKLSGTSGGRRSLYEVTSGLLKRGHEVRIFTNSFDKQRSFGELLTLPIEVVPCRETLMGRFAALMLSLEAVRTGEAASKWHPDVALIEGMPSWFPPYLCDIGDAAGVVFLHVFPERPWIPPSSNFFKKIYNLPMNHWQKASLERLTALIANSRYTAERFLELSLADSVPVEVVHLGVDHSKFHPTWEEENFILCVGRMDPRKNLELLIQAMKHVRSSTTLLIAGTVEEAYAEYMEELVRLTQQLHLGDRVRIQVISSGVDIVPLIQRCSFFVAPGLRETFGLAALEAMACGKPVIASNAGALPEVVGDGGLLLEPDPECWGEAVDRLLQDSGLRRRSGKEALTRSKLFTWDKHVDGLLRVFEKVA